MSDKLTNLLLVGAIVALVLVAIGLGWRMRTPAAEAEAAPSQAASAVLQITSAPAAVEVTLDGRVVGRTPTAGHQRFRSGPLKIEDLAPGAHVVAARRPGAETVSHELVLQAGENRHVHLFVWHPELVVRTTAGKLLTGMIVGQTTNSLELATSPTSVVTLNSEEIVSQRPTLETKMVPAVEPIQPADGSAPEYVIEPFPADVP